MQWLSYREGEFRIYLCFFNSVMNELTEGQVSQMTWKRWCFPHCFLKLRYDVSTPYKHVEEIQAHLFTALAEPGPNKWGTLMLKIPQVS